MLIFYIFTILGSANYFFVGCQGGDGVNIFLKIPHWCLGKKLCNNGEFSLAKNNLTGLSQAGYKTILARQANIPPRINNDLSMNIMNP
jgi:hypothetical protein